ncbi:MAG: hypothetical protein Q9212_002017 [Teloschistes hypoglaucus]
MRIHRPVSENRAAIASNTASAPQPPTPIIPKIEEPQHQDMEAVQDMEMDEDYDMKPETNAWGLPRMSQFDTNHQGLRNSTPTTPVTGNGTFNPTVSSVNTPTLIAHPSDSSTPGTPGEMDTDSVRYTRPRVQHGNFQFGNGNEMLDLCIDDPAKSLFSTNNASTGQLSNAQRLGDAQYSENSELAKTIREQQRLAGIPDGGSGPNDGVPKPFHCPVIGCEKAYKNQNGLKYHKSHGHNSQQLHSNGDGTFSIVDPETMNPYPGTVGMERHKPYRCEACGKRYKNLNGLKYHKSHSAACEDDKQPKAMDPPVNQAPQPVNCPQPGFVGMANNSSSNSAGLAGIDEDVVMS